MSETTAPGSGFPLDRWYVAALSWELTDSPLARVLLGRPIVLFRTPDGQVAALEDRCCHRNLPLSCGTLESRGLRCGYHGLLYGRDGRCIEIPGQDAIPPQAGVKAYPVREQERIVWIWFGRDTKDPPADPPHYFPHGDPRYQVGGEVLHYEAPFQLIHDNLLDLSHLGYVHLKTIGGNARLHMTAPTHVKQSGDQVLVTRHMPGSKPPPTYLDAWPFAGLIDRWQEIEFNVTYLSIWTGAVDADTESLDDPERGGFHLRGFHGITPESSETTHYFWTIAVNEHPMRPGSGAAAIRQSAATFLEDQAIIEKQWRNMKRFGHQSHIDIHVDRAPNSARRIVKRLL